MSYLKKYFVLVFALLLMILLAKAFLPFIIHPKWAYIVVFFFILNLLLYLYSNYALNKSNAVFMTAIFGGMAIKLFASIFFLLIFFIKQVDDKVLFTINFMVLYFFFTAFEIYSFMSNLRAQKKSGKTPNK